MNRDAVLRVLNDYMRFETDATATVARLDDLDFLDIAMQLEAEEGALLPQRFEELVPPPPYATVEAMADALIGYEAIARPSGVARPTPYPFCTQPEKCAGKSCCQRDPNCCD